MTLRLAAAGGDAALAFIELGAVAIALAVLARLAGRWGLTAIPFYLLAGLAVGEGGLAPLDVSADFISLAGDIGVLLLLLTLGLEYTSDELRQGLRTGVAPGLVDASANFIPGLLAGVLLGWEVEAALLLGGVCWVSSSGVIAKVLSDLDRLGNRETPAILNLLVIEDLAMAAFLPVMAALLAGTGVGDAALTVAISLVAVALILTLALRWGQGLSSLLARGSDEALLLSLFGLTSSSAVWPNSSRSRPPSVRSSSDSPSPAPSRPAPERSSSRYATCSRPPSSSSSPSRSVLARWSTSPSPPCCSLRSLAPRRWPPVGSPPAGWG